jgi:CheY-like chemotaxis protein
MNVIKHGHVEQATIRVRQTERNLRITVIDQGAGFDLAAAGTITPHSSKFGLFSIRERMTALGGEFHLDSAPGKGTTATLVLPLGNTSSQLGVKSAELAGGSSESTERSQLSIQNSDRETPPSPDDSEPLTQNSQLHEKQPIRVLLVDDHAMVRQGLRGLLDGYADIHVVGEGMNGEEAVALSDRLKPHVGSWTSICRRWTGIEATRRVKQASPEIAIIGLSIHNNPNVERAMREAGAAAFSYEGSCRRIAVPHHPAGFVKSKSAAQNVKSVPRFE